MTTNNEKHCNHDERTAHNSNELRSRNTHLPRASVDALIPNDTSLLISFCFFSRSAYATQHETINHFSSRASRPVLHSPSVFSATRSPGQVTAHQQQSHSNTTTTKTDLRVRVDEEGALHGVANDQRVLHAQRVGGQTLGFPLQTRKTHI